MASTSKEGVLVALAVGAGLLWGSGSLAFFTMLRAGGIVGEALAAVSNIVVLALALALARRQSPQRVFSVAGLGAGVRPALQWALLLFLLPFAACVVFGRIATPFNPGSFLWNGLGLPFLQEIFIRGLALGALLRFAGWRLGPAALFVAFFFAGPPLLAGKIAAQALLSAFVPALLVAFLVNLAFGALFRRWQFNLWPVVFLHMGLNLLWEVFSFGTGYLGSGLRIAIVLLALATTFLQKERTA